MTLGRQARPALAYHAPVQVNRQGARMTPLAGKTTRIAAATLAAATIAAPAAVLAAGSYNTRSDVRTLPAKAVTKRSADLGAMVAPNGVSVRLTLKITGPRFNRTVSLGTVLARTPVKTVYTRVRGLRVGTKYTVKATATNGGGKKSPGNAITFTTKR